MQVHEISNPFFLFFFKKKKNKKPGSEFRKYIYFKISKTSVVCFTQQANL